MGTLAVLVVAGLIGIIGHWLTRWAQGRTDSSFKDYMMDSKAKTVQSVMANLSSSFAIYTTLPEDIGGKALVMVAIGAYMAGYTFDSGLNRDTSVETIPVGLPKSKKVEVVKRESDEDIDAQLERDSRL